LEAQAKIIFANTNGKGLRYTQTAMFKSLPLTIREVKATEAVLNRVYDAAKLGLKGDNLALAAGLLPSEYRRLRELDPIAELAEQKGRADGEIAMSTVLHEAAMNGDSKAALEILKHAHGWVAKQQVSITAALEQAQSRVLELVHEVTDARAPVFGGPRARLDGQALESGDSERP
jgi:hypothetical protein